MNITSKENFSKLKWFCFAIYAIVCSIYLMLDYAIGEKLQIIFNLFLVFGITSLFSICLRYVFEVFLIKFVAYCTKLETLTLKKVVNLMLSASLIPVVGLLIGVVLRLVFVWARNDIFQTLWLGISHTPFYVYVFLQLSKFGIKKSMKIVLCVYFILYWCIQILSLFGI